VGPACGEEKEKEKKHQRGERRKKSKFPARPGKARVFPPNVQTGKNASVLVMHQQKMLSGMPSIVKEIDVARFDSGFACIVS
jgi:hypothetical protein